MDEDGRGAAPIQARTTPIRPGPVVRVHVDIATQREPIQGSTGLAGDAAAPFHGWLELAAALEGVRARTADEQTNGGER